MKRYLFLLLFVSLLLPGICAKAASAGVLRTDSDAIITDGFITTWSIAAGGDSITIPINTYFAGSYDYTVD